MPMEIDVNVAAFGPAPHGVGGWALREILERRIRERFPNAQIAHFHLGSTLAEDHGDAPWCVQRRFPFGPDVVVIGGGDLLDLGVDGAQGDYQGPYPPAASLWLIPALLAEKWGVPLLWNAPGAPRDFQPEEALFVNEACGPVRWRTVRDSLTGTALAEQGIENVHVAPDSRVLMDELWHGERWETARRRAMLPKSTGQTLCVQLSRECYNQSGDVLREQLRQLMDREVSQVLLMALTPGEQQSLQALRQCLGDRAIIVGQPRDALQLAAVISVCDLVVSTSLHVSLTALTLHVPHVAFGRRRKLQGYRKWLGLSLEANAESLADAVASVERQRTALPELHARLRRVALEHFQQLVQCIGESPVPKSS